MRILKLILSAEMSWILEKIDRETSVVKQALIREFKSSHNVEINLLNMCNAFTLILKSFLKQIINIVNLLS